jgi:hypothetical protein
LTAELLLSDREEFLCDDVVFAYSCIAYVCGINGCDKGGRFNDSKGGLRPTLSKMGLFLCSMGLE